MLDERKRKRKTLWLILLMVIAFAALTGANGWQSPLAVMPRTMFAMLIGYLLLYVQSVRVYPRLARYFDVDVLKRDAQQVPPPVPSE